LTRLWGCINGDGLETIAQQKQANALRLRYRSAQGGNNKLKQKGWANQAPNLLIHTYSQKSNG
jgi:hypothetical protein